MSPSVNRKTKTLSTPELKNGRHVLRACTKHSDHSRFCPIHHLALQYFNDSLRCTSTLQLVQGLARLVVRVRVVVAEAVEAREGLRQRTCSGVLTSVNEEGDDIIVMVPLHALQGDVQVADTSVDFFYDSEEDNDNNNVIITVRGKSLVRHRLQHIAQLTCHGCPELKQRFQQHREEDMALTFKALTRQPDLDSKRRTQGLEAALISHPHGYPKKVTFGTVCGREVGNRRVKGDQTSSEFCDDDDDDEDDVTLRSSGQQRRLLLTSDAVMTLTSSPPSQLSSLASLSNSCRASLRLTQTAEKRENVSGRATLLWSKILRLCSGPAALWARIVAFCSDFFRGLDTFRQMMLDLSEADSPEVVRVYHTCASCPGSSGGAVIPIGHPGVSRLDDESVTSLPVYLHVGVREGQGVAVPVSVSRGVLRLCFGGDPGLSQLQHVVIC